MEKDRHNIDQEIVLETAAQLALDSATTIGENSYSLGNEMVQKAFVDREQRSSSFNSGMEDHYHGYIRVTRRIFYSYVEDTHRAVDVSLTHPDDIDQAYRFVVENTDILLQSTGDANSIIGRSKKDLQQVVQNEEASGHIFIENTLNALRNKSQYSNVSFDNYLRILYSALNGLEQTIDRKANLLDSLCVGKLSVFEELIARKGASLQELSDRLRSEVYARIQQLKVAREASNQTIVDGEDPRIERLMGRATGADRRPYKILVSDVDFHREEGRTDQEIYRLLMRHFHPDISVHEHAEAVSKVLSSAYDKDKKRFIF